MEDNKPPIRNVTIHKAKLKKGLHLVVEYTEQLADGMRTKTENCTADVHDDLRNSFKVMAAHVGAMTDQFGKDGTISPNIECRGFSIKGEDENEGVTLTGLRTLTNGKVIVLNTPFLRFNQEDSYGPMSDLLFALNRCKEEIMKYLFEGKHAPIIQQKLEFPEDNNDDDI